MRLPGPTAVLLDEAPLSLLTRRQGHVQGDVCKAWYAALEAAGHRVFVPEIADFELRRELIRTGKAQSIARLDTFNAAESGRYLPLTTADVREAARLWALARNNRQGGAPPEALDGDVLIAAQATRFVLYATLSSIIVATSNPSHLASLVPAALWSDIQP